MRCNNCGWDNLENASVCIKCHTPLEKSELRKPSTEGGYFDKTIIDKDLVSGERPAHVFEKTVDENMDDLSGTAGIEKDILVSCPNPDCGYLNPGDAVICARCKRPLPVSQKNQATDKSVSRPLSDPPPVDRFSGKRPATSAEAPSGTIYNQPQYARQSFKGTIDPYRLNNDRPNCSLALILRDGEENQYPPGTVTQGLVTKEFELEKNSIELNRDNLDKNNITITGKVQAELFFENGKWYLLNRSDLKTTFIQVQDKIALKEGDTILMGDRKFIFSPGDK
ncbi:MAG: FHA domain-containing protein [Ferruginibacter sp.]